LFFQKKLVFNNTLLLDSKYEWCPLSILLYAVPLLTNKKGQKRSKKQAESILWCGGRDSHPNLPVKYIECFLMLLFYREKKRSIKFIDTLEEWSK